MDNPRTTASGDDLTMNMENPLGPFNTYGGQNRRDTVSTVSSEKHSPMPTGVWSLTLHGNCSRCHHHHKSAVVQFKIFDNPSEGSDVHCEHCKHKWLTIGGINTTQISLLSTRTTAVGSEEIDLRYRLNSIIRSATAIASPVALASVPEVLPNLPSRGHSQRMPSHEPESNTHANGKNKNRHDAELPTNLPIDQSNSTPSWSHRQRPQEPKPRWTKDFLRSLKRKLRDALPVLKGIHFRDLLDTPRKFKLASKTEGKRSVADEDHQVTKEVHDDAGKAHSQDGHSQVRELRSDYKFQRSCENMCSLFGRNTIPRL
ncbi:hypothetical protein P280DRAFT_293612 [Massarina eburnea CBS 473.64]|uniref:Uncharacterized protein n=1 Tax=Massarina eburnea CBS 473.64 TaxID=1395130 RepID=A0A6A6S4M8_9PLEO|nr:hypothetical protein P280DRAFT_293612 [Massarina eburnea CBS 473.64]